MNLLCCRTYACERFRNCAIILVVVIFNDLNDLAIIVLNLFICKFVGCSFKRDNTVITVSQVANICIYLSLTPGFPILGTNWF